MPIKPQSFCKWPGCNRLTRNGYCEEHLPLHESEQAEKQNRYNKSRGSASAQGYDYHWQKIRIAYLRRHPLCEMCEKEGRTTPAWGVHHIKPLKEGGTHNDDNLMAVCFACHEKIEGPDRWRKRE